MVTRDCACWVEGGRLKPNPATDIRVGPITFYGLRTAADRPPSEFTTTANGISDAWKTVTEVTASTRATLVVPRAERDRLALIYGDFISGRHHGYRLSDGTSAVRFEACPAEEARFSGRGTVGARTQFNGGFIVGKSGCYDVAVGVGGNEHAFRGAIGFGTSRCGCGHT